MITVAYLLYRLMKQENVCANDEAIFDKEDSSFTRPLTALLSLFDRCGLTIVDRQKQTGFPKAIYDVWIIALR